MMIDLNLFPVRTARHQPLVGRSFVPSPILSLDFFPTSAHTDLSNTPAFFSGYRTSRNPPIDLHARPPKLPSSLDPPVHRYDLLPQGTRRVLGWYQSCAYPRHKPGSAGELFSFCLSSPRSAPA
jgi:hypothetical protein